MTKTDQAATKDAFEVLHFIAGKRLAAGRLTVVDATNVQPEARKPLVALAREYHCLPVAIVFDLPRTFVASETGSGPTAIFGRTSSGSRHATAPLAARTAAGRLPPRLRLRVPEEVEAATIERQPLWNNRKRTSTDRSTSLAMCMAALTNWSCC